MSIANSMMMGQVSTGKFGCCIMLVGASVRIIRNGKNLCRKDDELVAELIRERQAGSFI